MGFEMYLFDFMFLLVELEQNADAFSEQLTVFFVVDSSHLHLTFLAPCLLYVSRNQQVEQYNYYDYQSEFLTRFRTDFTSSVWNFCR